jgi:competence protein ComEC
VSFIDVGWGDAILISDPAGFDVLIDGGKRAAGPALVEFLRQQAVDDIDVMLLTHGHNDHCGGLIEVLETPGIPVRKVLYSGYPGDNLVWESFHDHVVDEGLELTPVHYPQQFTWGQATARILNPHPDMVEPTLNDASVVVLLQYGNTRFLFTGDISKTVEKAVANRARTTVDILKVAHHGDEESSNALFLSKIAPREAVISVGENNFDLPSPGAIARLQAAGARIWRTDKYSTVTIYSDGQNYTVEPALTYSQFFFLPVLPGQIP